MTPVSCIALVDWEIQAAEQHIKALKIVRQYLARSWEINDDAVAAYIAEIDRRIRAEKIREGTALAEMAALVASVEAGK